MSDYQQQPHIPNYLVQAILVTLFCCLPAGVVAIVFAAQVNGHVAAGNLAEAQRLSNSAKTWCWVSFWVAAGLVIVYLLLMAILIAGSGF